MASPAFSRWADVWPALIALAVLALLPIGRISELRCVSARSPDWFCSGQRRAALSHDRAVTLAAMLFACYWLPTLISAPAAIAPAKTWTTVGTLLRFLPFALFAALALRDEAVWPRIVAGAATRRRAVAAGCMGTDPHRLQSRRRDVERAPVRHFRRGQSQARSRARRAVAVRVRRRARSAADCADSSSPSCSS